MKRTRVFVFGIIFFCSGCGTTTLTPTQEVVKENIPPAVMPTEMQESVTPQSVPNPQEIVARIETQIASQSLVTMKLPIATQFITKRELVGYVDSTRTGKISRIVEGLGNTKETYYYDQGVLVLSRFEADSEDTKSRSEMFFVNGKMSQYTFNGKDVTQETYAIDDEDRNLEFAKSVLDQFLLQQ